MWNDPVALNRLSRLILAVTLLFTVWTVGRAAAEKLAPFWQVQVVGVGSEETYVAAKEALGKLRGGFFALDLVAARAEFERLPWVRHAEIRRVWPGRLAIILEEHRAAAAWNDRALLNTHGEVFAVVAMDQYLGLPRLYAPEGTERETARRYGEFVAVVKPLGMRVEQVVVTTRQSWRVRLQGGKSGAGNGVGGVLVELGRDHLSDRLARFARFYPQAVESMGPIARADMRYPNGFAAQVKGGPVGGQPMGRKMAKDVNKA
ncbi:MAG: cell division protein FtsQ/DivIB [Pseudomonadota bacterium]|nr:cell division protein FtsQ/DivIB [Pseudomonadota bacterium]MDP1905799.1 cell division protein FtsQ/DivIB [Pseudomonadota bacterium]MDP2354029.1 cell division protein FtsQ/DivIB [Pseudomonadota bacterium]